MKKGETRDKRKKKMLEIFHKRRTEEVRAILVDGPACKGEEELTEQSNKFQVNFLMSSYYLLQWVE